MRPKPDSLSHKLLRLSFFFITMIEMVKAKVQAMINMRMVAAFHHNNDGNESEGMITIKVLRHFERKIKNKIKIKRLY